MILLGWNLRGRERILIIYILGAPVFVSPMAGPALGG